MDARGHKKGINAAFKPPIEQLAFPINIEGEFDLPTIYAEPLKSVTQVLNTYKSYQDVLNNLADMNDID